MVKRQKLVEGEEKKEREEEGEEAKERRLQLQWLGWYMLQDGWEMGSDRRRWG